jgi:hypothetical protein
MSHKLIHGYTWLVFPDPFAIGDSDSCDPGHPFCSRPGEIAPPGEVIHFRAVNPADAGVCNEKRDPSYLVVTNSQFHPKVSQGWESEPANLTDKFKTGDGKLRMIRVIQQHHKRFGDLMECELRVEGA